MFERGLFVGFDFFVGSVYDGFGVVVVVAVDHENI